MHYRNVRRGSAFAIAIATLSFLSTLGAREQLDSRTPDEVFDSLVSFQHGLAERMMDEETRALLRGVVENPIVYVQVISNAMKFRSEVPMDDYSYRRAGTAIGLARKTDRADLFSQSVLPLIEQLTKRIEHLREIVKPKIAVENEKVRGEYQRVLVLRSSALKLVSDWGDPGAAQLCIEWLIEEREYMSGADIVMLRYLQEVAPLRPDIRTKLEAMYNSKTSLLRKHPQLLRVLEAIDKAEAEKKRNQRAKEGGRESTPDP